MRASGGDAADQGDFRVPSGGLGVEDRGAYGADQGCLCLGCLPPPLSRRTGLRQKMFRPQSLQNFRTGPATSATGRKEGAGTTAGILATRPEPQNQLRESGGRHTATSHPLERYRKAFLIVRDANLIDGSSLG